MFQWSSTSSSISCHTASWTKYSSTSSGVYGVNHLVLVSVLVFVFMCWWWWCYVSVILNKLFHLLPYSQLDEVQRNIVRCVWCQPFGVSVSVGVCVHICVGDGGVMFQWSSTSSSISCHTASWTKYSSTSSGVYGVNHLVLVSVRVSMLVLTSVSDGGVMFQWSSRSSSISCHTASWTKYSSTSSGDKGVTLPNYLVLVSVIVAMLVMKNVMVIYCRAR